MKNCEHVLYENNHATYFTEAYPIGNGHLGGMVYGEPGNMRLGLNHDELWAGYRMGVSEYYDKNWFLDARRLALEGKYLESQKILEEKFARYNSGGYLTLGDLFVSFASDDISDYRRELNLRESRATVDFKSGDNSISFEYIASYPKNVIAIRIASSSPFDFSVEPRLEMIKDQRAEGTRVMLFGECDNLCARQLRRGTLPEDRDMHRGVRFASAVDIVTDGSSHQEDGKLLVKGATESVIYFATETSFKDGCEYGTENFAELCASYLDSAMSIGYWELLSEHVADVTELYDRVELHLASENAVADRPTSERIEAFAAGEEDNELITLEFNMGRYLLIAASRKGSLATTLQGIWNDKMDAPWCSNYTTNINTEMNYWPALPCAMPELLDPLEKLIRSISVSGAKVARDAFSANGFTASHNADGFGYALPAFGMACWSFFPMSAGWLLRELVNKYDYTLDRDYLESIWDLIYGASEFYLDTLVDDGDYLIFAPGTSPENHYFLGDEQCSVGRSSTMYASIIRETLENLVRASEILGKECELVERAKAAIPRLLPLRITSDGRIEEWYFGGESVSPREPEITHRHISHLYDLYPNNKINPREPELFAAARESLRVRGDEATGWSLGWKMNCYARLRDGEGVMRLLRMFTRPVPHTVTNTLHGGGVYTNLFCAHPPFQIDGNFGFTAAIAEMLVICEGDRLELLPALPKELSRGSVKGLAIKGNRRLDLEWDEGRVTKYNIY